MRKLDGKTFAATLRCALSVLLLFPFALSAQAQDAVEASAPQREDTAAADAAGRGARPREDAVGLLLQLGLSPEQRAQLIEIRRQSAPEGQALGRRLNQARRALDAAIYADIVDEAAVEQLAREVAVAQAAVVRMRALTELRVRRVLTPAQLDMFRRLRREAFLRQRFGRRAGRRGGEGEGNSPRRRRQRPLFDNRLDNRLNDGTGNPSDHGPQQTPSLPSRPRRPKP